MNLPLPPDGDPGAIRELSRHWMAAAAGLEQAALPTAQQGADGALLGWQGAGAASFDLLWQEVLAPLQQLPPVMRDMASRLDGMANQLETAQAAYRQKLAHIAEIAAVGVGLTLVSAGSSDAIAGGIATEEVASLAYLVTSVAELLDVAAADLLTISDQLLQLAARFAVYFTANVAFSNLRTTIDGAPVPGFGRLAEWAAVATLVTPLADSLVAGTAAAGTPAWATAMASAGLSTGAINLLLTGQVNGGRVAGSALLNLLGSRFGLASYQTGNPVPLTALQYSVDANDMRPLRQIGYGPAAEVLGRLQLPPTTRAAVLETLFPGDAGHPGAGTPDGPNFIGPVTTGQHLAWDVVHGTAAHDPRVAGLAVTAGDPRFIGPVSSGQVAAWDRSHGVDPANDPRRP